VTWGPGGGHEVLAHGAEEPARRSPALLAVVAGASLVVGYLAGTRLAPAAVPVTEPAGAVAPTDAATGAGPGMDPVAAGIVSRVQGEPWSFRVSLFNTGDDDITATVVSLPGWTPPLTDTRASAIAGRSWGMVRFSAPPDCMTYPGDVRVIHIRIWTDSGVANRVVPLSQPARVLRDHYEERCAPPPTR
jgi:hypothetical protein